MFDPPSAPARDGILTLAMLERDGVGASRRSALIASGDLMRLRNGWFATRNANPEQLRAVRLGGRLTCVSALRQHRLWVMPDSRLHVAVNGNASRLRSPDDRRKSWQDRSDVCLHWAESAWKSAPDAAIDGVKASLAQLIRCVDRTSAIVTLDSALNGTASGGPLITSGDLTEILALLPAKHATIAGLVDAKAQSGLETLARLRLRCRGLRVRTQAPVEGVGHVDVLIGDRLVLELDSRTHHLGKGYETDRARDLELFRRGFIVLRVSYDSVMYHWQAVEDAILLAVRRGDHLRRAVHKRLGLAQLALPD
jgi:very-short-patch-repair endonuclease